VLAAREPWLAAARERLEKAFGPVDLQSDVWPFDFTRYYAEEMGHPLLRRIYSFQELIRPENLVAAKHTTNRLEKELARRLEDAPARPVNLDPGYVILSKVVLATTKDHAHRLYVGSGIYAEVTLNWQGGDFEPRDWTYPDYCTEHYREFLRDVRRTYQEKLNEARR
jgi:hypothetical protein